MIYIKLQLPVYKSYFLSPQNNDFRVVIINANDLHIYEVLCEVKYKM